MKLHSHCWQDWRSPQLAAFLAGLKVQQRDYQALAVLPIAAVEQHGPHLPLAVDAAIAEHLCQRVQAQLTADQPIFFLPSMAVGLSPEHEDYCGTLSLRPETALALWQDLAASVARAGLSKLLIFNTHGGNVGLMDVAARQIRQRWGMAVWHSSWFNLPLPAPQAALFDAHEQRFGIHAGAVETACMLHIAPHLVAQEEVQNFISRSAERSAQWPMLGDGKSAKLGWLMQDYHVSGAAGDARAASAEAGAALLEAATGALAQLLSEMSAIPLEQVLGPPQPQ